MFIKLTKQFREFYQSEKSGGMVLIACTIVSLILANSPLQADYLNLWHVKIGNMSLEHWINDGLMAIFFLLIGLELEREIYVGELSSLRSALLPMAGALGGMCVPAGIYALFNCGLPTSAGTGIPTATDIAFALGILSLLGKKVPPSLKIFLAALAVVDDLGAIVIISLFYTKGLVFHHLLISLGIFAILLVMNRIKVKNLIPYIIGGIMMWYFMLQSGVHATITGVLLAFAIPFWGRKESQSPSLILQHYLHYPVAFFVLPVFALANTAIIMDGNLYETVSQPFSIGIWAGLILGKPIGIFSFCFIALSMGICRLPIRLNWKHILAVGCLGGIGFTMSIFITLLAFDDQMIINNSKLTILMASCISAIIGFFMLKLTLRDMPERAA